MTIIIIRITVIFAVIFVPIVIIHNVRNNNTIRINKGELMR